jgi:hypothetical protein
LPIRYLLIRSSSLSSVPATRKAARIPMAVVRE